MPSPEELSGVSEIRIGPIETLRNPNRRGVLFVILQEGPQPQDELASKVFVRGKKKIDDIQNELIRAHLPILDEAGFIDWDQESGMVTKGGRFDEIIAALKAMGDEDDR